MVVRSIFTGEMASVVHSMQACQLAPELLISLVQLVINLVLSYAAGRYDTLCPVISIYLLCFSVGGCLFVQVPSFVCLSTTNCQAISYVVLTILFI